MATEMHYNFVMGVASGMTDAKVPDARALEVDAANPDPWQCLERRVSREPKRDAERLIVADSKRVFARNRPHFGERRRDGARRMEGGGWGGLFCLRKLSGALSVPG